MHSSLQSGPQNWRGHSKGGAERVGGLGAREGAQTQPEPARVPRPPLGTRPQAGSRFQGQTPPHSEAPPIALKFHATAQHPPGPSLTGVAVGTEVAMAAAALARPHTHLVVRARRVAFAHRCERDRRRCRVSSPYTIPPSPRPHPCPAPQEAPLTDPTLIPLLPPAGAAHGLLGAADRERAPEPEPLIPVLSGAPQKPPSFRRWLLRPWSCAKYCCSLGDSCE